MQKANALRNIEFVAWIGLALLLVGGSVAIVIGRTVGRSIVNAEREVRMGRERLRATLMSIGDGVITTDVAGHITTLNAVAQALTGWSQEEAAGISVTRVFRIVNEDTRAEVANPVYRALAEGAITGLANHTRLIAKDGTERPIEDSAAPIKEGSVVSGAVLVFRDISDRSLKEAALRERAQILRDNEERLRRFIDNAPAAMAQFDRDMRYLAASRRWLDNFGCTEEVIGRSHYEVFREVPEAWKVAHRQALPGEVVRANADRFERASGAVQWVKWEARPWRDASNEIGGIVIGTEDITQRKLAEDALHASLREVHALKTALDEHAIVAITDPAGRITFVNDKFCAISKYARDELLGQDHRIINSGHHPKSFFQRLWRTISRGQVWHGQIQNRAKDGSIYWVDTTIVPFLDEDGKPRQYVAIRADITQHKEAEKALREVALRKDEFLATLAHELRNPLAPVRNAVQILRIKSTVVPELQWACAVIDRQTRAMSRLIEDLMDVSRINQDKIELKREPVELSAVIEAAVETSLPLIEQMDHELDVDLPPDPLIIDADRTRLTQVFNNLLNNAAKYTERGGRIELTAAQQGSDVVVSVRDTGIGIAADVVPTLFGMFSQVEAALSRAQGGLGIGLYLVKRLVEMHGGRIDVRSDGPGKGSEFMVRLPVVLPRLLLPPADDGAPPAIPTSNLRIVVADDNQDAADGLSALLTMMGNEVRTVYDGEAAVQAAGEFDPHLMLLDIGMPRLNGLEAARAIRRQQRRRNVILVAVTGWGQDEDRRKSREAGFDLHLVKPVDPQVLMKMLAEFDFVRG